MRYRLKRLESRYKPIPEILIRLPEDLKGDDHREPTGEELKRVTRVISIKSDNGKTI